MTAMLRRREVEARSGKRTSTLYDDIANGLFPPGVPIGAKSRAWPDGEVEAINRARIAGHTEEQIRALVRRLIAARKHAATPEVAAQPAKVARRPKR